MSHQTVNQTYKLFSGTFTALNSNNTSNPSIDIAPDGHFQKQESKR